MKKKKCLTIQIGSPMRHLRRHFIKTESTDKVLGGGGGEGGGGGGGGGEGGGGVGRRLICRHNNGNNGARGAPGIIRE